MPGRGPRAQLPALLPLVPAGLLIGLVFLLPFGLVGVTAFWAQAPGSWIVEQTFTTRNFDRILNDGYFAAVIGRTLRIGAEATLICLLLGLPVALRIIRARGQTRGLLFVLMLLPMVSGALVQTLGLLNLFSLAGVVNGALKQLGLISQSVHFLGNEAGVLLGLVQAFLPLMVLPLVSVLGGIPPDLPAAAASLGASRLQTLRRIVLPLAGPGIAGGAILVFSASVTSFVTPQILGQGHVQMFGPLVYQQAALVLDWPFASALCVVMLAALGFTAMLVGAGARLAMTPRR
jgi:ABC-type spermidine/putrescine transport system permease subunit I